jgi:hypothetical protein
MLDYSIRAPLAPSKTNGQNSPDTYQPKYPICFIYFIFRCSLDTYPRHPYTICIHRVSASLATYRYFVGGRSFPYRLSFFIQVYLLVEKC